MAFVRKKASADWRRLSVSLPFANGELTASLASAVKDIRDQTSPDSTGARHLRATHHDAALGPSSGDTWHDV